MLHKFCKRCNISIEPSVRPRQDTPHDAEYRCPLCESHLGWRKKEKNEQKREKNQHTPFSLGIDTCQCCQRSKNRLGKNETLIAHHVYEIQQGGPDIPENIWVVCTFCHQMIHHFRTYLNEHFKD